MARTAVTAVQKSRAMIKNANSIPQSDSMYPDNTGLHCYGHMQMNDLFPPMGGKKLGSMAGYSEEYYKPNTPYADINVATARCKKAVDMSVEVMKQTSPRWNGNLFYVHSMIFHYKG